MSPVRLRPGVHVAPLDDGLLVRGWSTSFSVTGQRSLYTLMERLLPVLEAGVEVDELVASMPDQVGVATRYLLDELGSHDLLLDDAADGALEAGVEKEHAATLGYLSQVADRPREAMSALLSASVSLVGDGPAADAAAAALVRSGVDVHRDDAPTTGDHERPHPRLRIVLLDGPPDGSAGASATSPADGVPVLAACVLGDGAVLAPVARGASDPTLTDVLRRVRPAEEVETDDSAVEDDPWRPVAGHEPMLLLLGGCVAHAALHQLTGVSLDQDRRVALLDASTLTVSRHPVLPTGTTAGAWAGVVRDEPDPGPDPADGAPPDLAVLLEGVQDLIDERTGLVPPPRPRRLPQLPLAVSTTQAAGTTVVGAGLVPRESRLRTLLEALRRQAAQRPPANGADRVVATGAGIGTAWRADSLLRALVEIAAAPTTWGHGEAPSAVPTEVRPEVEQWWSALTRRFGVGATSRTALLDLPVEVWAAEVSDDARVLGVGYGPDRDVALRVALRNAVLLRQLDDADADEPRTGATGSPVADLLDAPGLLDWFHTSLPRLADRGWRLEQCPDTSEPAVTTSGLGLGWTALTRDRS